MKQCLICHKTSRMAGTRILLRGHYNPTNWSRKFPNLQRIRLPAAKAGFKQGESVLVCTQCIRTFGKTARIEKKKALKAEKASKAAAEPKVETPKVEAKPKAEVKKEKAPATAEAKAGKPNAKKENK